MATEKKLKLVDGTFSAKDSKEILLNIFSSKIHFHQLKNFSSQELNGVDNKIAMKRIPQLQKCMETILKTMTSAEKKGKKVTIKSEVFLTIE